MANEIKKIQVEGIKYNLIDEGAARKEDVPIGDIDLTLTDHSISDGTTTFEVIANPTETGSEDLAKIKVAGTIYNITGGVTGVKGNSETDYRTGNVNLTASNIGADEAGAASTAEANAKAYTYSKAEIDNKDTDIRTLTNGKVDKLTTLTNSVYTHSAGTQGEIPYDDMPTGNSIARRTSSGALAVGAPIEDSHAARKQEVDAETTRATAAESALNDKVQNKTEAYIVDATWFGAPTNYTNYRKQDGTSFASAAEVASYIEGLTCGNTLLKNDVQEQYIGTPLAGAYMLFAYDPSNVYGPQIIVKNFTQDIHFSDHITKLHNGDDIYTKGGYLDWWIYGIISTYFTAAAYNGKADLSTYLRYTSQSLTDAQKSQARTNIGAGTSSFSGNYNDLTNKPTIPTVNNGTLTIQRNGTTVKTFTANQSSNVTANISVPVNFADLSARGDNYLQWGGENLKGNVSPVDAAVEPEIGGNKWAFASPASFVVQYSTTSGSSYIDYGLSDADKTAITSTSRELILGKDLTTAYAQNRLRIYLNSNTAGGSTYTALKKILINFSTSGATGCQVVIEKRTIGDYVNGNDVWSNVGTFDLAGWSGWNSIPANLTLGGNTSQTSQIAQLRLTFVQTGGTANSRLTQIKMIGETNWATPSNMARKGHLYDYDVSQNAYFPANIETSAVVKANQFKKVNGTSSQFLKADGSVDSNTYAKTSQIPTVGSGTITINQGGTTKGTFSVNQTGNTTVNLDVTKIVVWEDE